MRRWLPLAGLVALVGCASDDGPNAPGSQTAVPVWEPAVQVAPAGPGFPITPRGFGVGAAQTLVVNAEGWAFLGAIEAFAEQVISARFRSWGNVYDPRAGWQTPVRLAPPEVDVANEIARDVVNGSGLTPDGALFGWRSERGGSAGSTSYGLRGFDVRRGWVAPGTLLSHNGSPGASLMTTARDGIPVVAYSQPAGTFFVRHAGVLEGPELVLADRSVGALGADDAGNVAVEAFGGALAIRAPDGRWLQTRVPATQAMAGSLSIVPLSGGGFLLVWYELEGQLFVDEVVRYKTATVDPAARWSAVIELGSGPAPGLDPIFGRFYDASPQAAVGPTGAAIAAWRGDGALFVARQTSGRWGMAERVPNAAPLTGTPAVRAFGATMDASGTVLLAWIHVGEVLSAQQRAGQAWSAVAPVGVDTSTGGASSLLLATNASGTAFAAWRSGDRIMAARSPSR